MHLQVTFWYVPSKMDHVDSDEILICEAFNIATQTAKTLSSEEMVTQKADKLIEGMSVDQFDNVVAELEMGGEKHRLTLNAKVTRRGDSLDKVILHTF